MTDVYYPFPKTSRQTAYEAQRPALRVVEPTPRLPVEQDGGRVLILGRRAKTFMSETNAIRSVEALRLLSELGWPIERLVDPEPQTAA